MSRAVLVCAVVAALSSTPGAARAESYHTCEDFIDSLPATLTTQGTWCLRGDLSTSLASGAAITVATNNVTIDCNGFKVGNLAAGTGTATSGIYAINRLNTVVRNCSIRGFMAGVSLLGDGGGHLVENNRLDANRIVGIEVAGDGSLIRGNRVLDSGESTLQNSVFGVAAVGAVDIVDNIIDGVRPKPTAVNGTSIGLYVPANSGGMIMRNRVAGLESLGTGYATAIQSNSAGPLTIVDNVLVGDARAGGHGVKCAHTNTLAKDNVVMRFEDAVDTCTEVGTSP